jgi:hypothetical protein
MMSPVQTRDICSGCFDLNLDFFPAKQHEGSSVMDEWCALDEWWMGVRFSDIRSAAMAEVDSLPMPISHTLFELSPVLYLF